MRTWSVRGGVYGECIDKVVDCVLENEDEACNIDSCLAAEGGMCREPHGMNFRRIPLSAGWDKLLSSIGLSRWN